MSGPVTVDPLDPANHDRPLWIVYGTSSAWPSLLLAKILACPDQSVNIWGYSVCRRVPGYRTLGIPVSEWRARYEYGPFFYDTQEAALAHLATLTTPKAKP